MATERISTWEWWHQINDEICLHLSYGLYADMSHASTQPFLRVEDYQIRTLRNTTDWLTPYLPCTLKLHIDDEEQVYTFRSGGGIQHYDSKIIQLDVPGDATPQGGEVIGYYYVSTSSGVAINIPRDGQEFLIHGELTTNKPLSVPDLDEDGNEQLDEDGEVIMKEVPEVITFTEHGAGPICEILDGPDEINTGEVAQYTLSRPIRTSGKYSVSAGLSMYFDSWGSSSAGFDAYADPYTPFDKKKPEVTVLEFLPVRAGATIGEKSTRAHMSFGAYYERGKDAAGFLDYYRCIGYNMEPGSVSKSVPWIAYNPSEKIIISSVQKDLVCTAVANVDESLRPEFTNVTYDGSYGGYQRQVEHYGGAVQGQADYGITVHYQIYPDSIHGSQLQYGSRFTTIHVDDYTSGNLVEWQRAGYTATQQYSVPLLTNVTDAEVILTSKDTLGFSTTYTDHVTVLPYHAPEMVTYRARRCSPASWEGEDLYYDNGTAYAVDDYGEYALVEWAVDFSSLNNLNSRSLTIKSPGGANGGYLTKTIDLPDYVCSGYYVVPADPEQSYLLVFTLEDDMYGRKSGTYCDRYYRHDANVFSYPLNTALAMMDFKRGGTGVALGKVSELEKVFDIHRNWLLKMPNATMVQNYRSDGDPVRLADWMHTCEDRMEAIRNAKPWGIYGERYRIGHAWFDGYTPALIPEGGGEVYSGGNYRCMMVVPNRDTIVGITHVEPFTVNRNYLNVRFDPTYSFRGQGFYNDTYKPMIYLCSTRPTTIDQTTGKPDATIVDYQQITTSYSRVGSNEDGYTYWRCERGHSLDPDSGWTGFDTGILHSFNVASRKGQQLWVVVTCRQGGKSQSEYYTYNGGQLNLYDIVLSNSRANYEHY